MRYPIHAAHACKYSMYTLVPENYSRSVEGITEGAEYDHSGINDFLCLRNMVSVVVLPFLQYVTTPLEHLKFCNLIGQNNGC